MKKNALFIHIPKTAGTTIRTVLDFKEYRNPKEIPENTPQHVSFGHVDYAGLYERGYIDPEFHKNSFKFTFVRNPYGRAVSLYEYYLKTGKITPRSFKEFVSQLDSVAPIGVFNQQGWSQCNPQVRWIERVDIDFIGYFEFLEKDLKKVAFRIGKTIPNELPRLNKTIDKSLSSYYDRDTKRMVETVYEEDFEMLGPFFYKRV